MERWKQTGHICRWMALGITFGKLSLYRCTEIEWIERLGT